MGDKNSENKVGGLIHIKYIEKLKNQEPNRICFLLDGGANTKKAFEITITEFLPRLKNRELVGCHIYDSINDSEFNWQYKKNYVLDQYLFSFDRIIKYPNLLYLQNKKYQHNIIQAYDIAFNLSSKYFIFNFYSLKEQNLLIKNIFNGLDFLLTENKLPTLIMKDELMRNDKEKGVSNNKGYTWLILFDGTNMKSYYILEYFWPLIDRTKDFIYVLTLVNNSFYSDQIKSRFINKMNQYHLRENINYFYSFDCIPGKKQFKYLKEFINFNEDYYFDFVLFYNNPLKYKVKRNDSYELIMQIKANIGFVNLENLDNFSPEELIDYKEIERIEKEEKRKRRMLERAEQSIERGFRDLQYALLAQYEDKKLEREDTNPSLLNNSNHEENDNINNNNNDNDFIFTNNLILLPKVKTGKNLRYKENNKEDVYQKTKISERNVNLNTLSAPKLKNRTSSKIYINARNKNDINITTSKAKLKLGERNNIISVTQRAKNIKPMNLREKLNLNVKNKIKQ